VAFGGPIRKNSTFFFVDWQGTRNRTAATQTSSVPTPAMRLGDFSSGFNTIYDPATTRSDGRGGYIRDAFPGNRIPADRFDPAAARVLAYYPLPNSGSGRANNYILSGPGRGRDDQGDVRIDHSFGDKDKLMARHSINDNSSVPSPAFPTEGNPANYPARGRLQNRAAS
jgi:hypothetical protein